MAHETSKNKNKKMESEKIKEQVISFYLKQIHDTLIALQQNTDMMKQSHIHAILSCKDAISSILKKM